VKVPVYFTLPESAVGPDDDVAKLIGFHPETGG
jgi:hypothetical protein